MFGLSLSSFQLVYTYMWSLLVLKFPINPSFALLLLYAAIALWISLPKELRQYNSGPFTDMSMSDHISAICKSYFSHIRDLRRISYLDHNTAVTNATSLIHS